jgi:hypothetical protein
MIYNWHLILGIIAGVIGVASVIPYIRDMLYGTTRPNIVTSLVWTLIQILVVSIQFSEGASYSIILPIAQTVSTILVAVLCLKGYGYKEYGWTDKICFGFAIISIILWQGADQPMISLTLLIFADLFGTIPTITKTYKYPQSESRLAWQLAFLASLLSILSTNIFDYNNLAYPVYFLLIDLIILFLIVRKKA